MTVSARIVAGSCSGAKEWGLSIVAMDATSYKYNTTIHTEWEEEEKANVEWKHCGLRRIGEWDGLETAGGGSEVQIGGARTPSGLALLRALSIS